MTFLPTLFLAAVLAAPSSSGFAFETIETSACTFKLCGIRLSEPQQKGIMFGIECIQQTYTDLLGFTFAEGFKVKAVLFETKEDFLRYQQAMIGKVVSQSGYYSGSQREAVVWLQGGLDKMVAVLFHEASHMLLREAVPWCPLWINEGLAEYFESLDLFRKNHFIRLQETRMDWCKHWLKNGFPVEFEPFFAMDRERWMAFDEQNNNAGYTIGYSIVYFLMTNSQTQAILKEILWDFKRHGHKADSVATINRFYPGGIKRLELHWKRWIPRARPTKPLKAVIDKYKERQEQRSTETAED